MSALDRLTPYLHGPVTIRFPRMSLLARDNEPSLAEGEGEFEIVSEQEFRYKMTGRPVDLGHTLRALNRPRNDRYDGLHRFRLVMTDADGKDWAGAWTVPNVDFDREPWVFSGTCETLSTDVHGGPTELGGAEVRFLIPENYAASIVLRRFVQTIKANGDRSPNRTVEVLGTPVTFEFDDSAGVLTLSAPSTRALPAHYAENWLGEPLRVLFGQLTYPRLVQRRFSNGRSMLSVRKSPRWNVASSWLALWIGDHQFIHAEEFFNLYSELLSLVARGSNWESHTVTGFYEEVIQAARGSSWVCALTLASSIEGLTRLIVPADTLRADANATGLRLLSEHIATWDGAVRLKDAAIGFVQRLDFVSVNRALLDLTCSGVGTRTQVDSWKKVRNSVMHGELVSPYSSEEDDQILVDMAELLRALTREAARRGSADSGPICPSTSVP